MGSYFCHSVLRVTNVRLRHAGGESDETVLGVILEVLSHDSKSYRPTFVRFQTDQARNLAYGGSGLLDVRVSLTP